MVLVLCPSSHSHLSINQVSLKSLLYFPRYGPDRHPLLKNKWLTGDNSVNIQGRKKHNNPECKEDDAPK